jgi:hypothetical protein
MNPITEHYAIYRGSLEYHHRHTALREPWEASSVAKTCTGEVIGNLQGRTGPVKSPQAEISSCFHGECAFYRGHVANDCLPAAIGALARSPVSTFFHGKNGRSSKRANCCRKTVISDMSTIESTFTCGLFTGPVRP